MAYCSWKTYKLKVSPLGALAAFARGRNIFFLESSLNRESSLGRYSFLGADPFFILKARNSDPFARLRELLAKYKMPASSCPLPFSAGAVGYLAYDLGFILEKKIRMRPKPGPDIPDCFFGFYNTVIGIDHYKNTLTIIAAGFPEKNYLSARALAKDNFQKAYQLLSQGAAAAGREENCQSGCARLKSDFTRAEYLAAIKKAKDYIKAGDIYQVNLAQQFQTESRLPGLEIYRRLRRLSPAYFSAYLDAGDFQVISSSPERFLQLQNNRVSTRPMKGTRPRDVRRREDSRLKKELLASAKDQAELMMIVDLERNDLGRVCAYDSVRVDKLRHLEEYSTVFQTTASICGKLHRGKDRIDLLRAAFPGGSITGCPKIRAMEIIEELEPSRRSLYTGALGYLSFSGEMDFNILIRTILKKAGRLYFGAGGGIVADSCPEDEYNETLVKARAMIAAITPQRPAEVRPL